MFEKKMINIKRKKVIAIKSIQNTLQSFIIAVFFIQNLYREGGASIIGLETSILESP